MLVLQARQAASDEWLAAVMNSLVLRVRNKAGRVFLKNLFKFSMVRRDDLKRLGSSYGGWVVPTSMLSEASVCYCAGVGEDITFDLALIDLFGCDVFAFDPTPRSVKYVEENAADVARFHFYDVGLWSSHKTLRFYAPEDPTHVSHSVVNLQRTSTFFEAECKRLSSLMEELGHERIDLLKLDIEGAEYAVLDSMMEDGIYASVLCVEFDPPDPIRKNVSMVRKLIAFGYSLVSVDEWNYTFVWKGRS